MYFFVWRGHEFFDRYRRRLKARDDIRAASALSSATAQLAALYHRGPRRPSSDSLELLKIQQCARLPRARTMPRWPATGRSSAAFF
jgi:hypothetical protein